MISSRLLVLTCFLACIFFQSTNPVNSAVIIKRGAKDWSAVDWDKLEADWVSSDRMIATSDNSHSIIMHSLWIYNDANF